MSGNYTVRPTPPREPPPSQQSAATHRAPPSPPPAAADRAPPHVAATAGHDGRHHRRSSPQQGHLSPRIGRGVPPPVDMRKIGANLAAESRRSAQIFLEHGRGRRAAASRQQTRRDSWQMLSDLRWSVDSLPLPGYARIPTPRKYRRLPPPLSTAGHRTQEAAAAMQKSEGAPPSPHPSRPRRYRVGVVGLPMLPPAALLLSGGQNNPVEQPYKVLPAPASAASAASQPPASTAAARGVEGPRVHLRGRWRAPIAADLAHDIPRQLGSPPVSAPKEPPTQMLGGRRSLVTPPHRRRAQRRAAAKQDASPSALAAAAAAEGATKPLPRNDGTSVPVPPVIEIPSA
jgi:hypothetical protein